MSYCILSAFEYMSREIAKEKYADIVSDAMVIGLNEVQTIWALSVYPFLNEPINFFSVMGFSISLMLYFIFPSNYKVLSGLRDELDTSGALKMKRHRKLLNFLNKRVFCLPLYLY